MINIAYDRMMRHKPDKNLDQQNFPYPPQELVGNRRRRNELDSHDEEPVERYVHKKQIIYFNPKHDGSFWAPAFKQADAEEEEVNCNILIEKK